VAIAIVMGVGNIQEHARPVLLRSEPGIEGGFDLMTAQSEPHRSAVRRVGATLLGAIRGLIVRRMETSRPVDAVTVTSGSVERDTRALKQAASFARWGIGSTVFEAHPSERLRDDGRLPFELRPLPSFADLATRFSGKPWYRVASGAVAPYRAVRAGWRLASYLSGWYGTYLRENVIAPFVGLPPARLYYLHAPQLFVPVYLRCLLHGGRFIYDAHDFYSRIETPQERSLTDRVFIAPFERAIERACARRAAAVITVSESLAAEQRAAFDVPVSVVRNAHDRRLERAPAQDIRRAIGAAPDDFVIVVIGQAKRGQVIEPALEALKAIPRVRLVFLGENQSVRQDVVERAGVGERVHLLPPVLPDEVVPFVRSADAAALLYVARTVNYERCLPNGLFQSLAAGLPVLYPPLPEIKALADRFGFGIAIDPTDPASIVAAVRRLVGDGAECRARGQAAAAASRELEWSIEEDVLQRVVESTIGRAAS
jgi:glycosyltransferase involved in cell wall biosynthesis